MKSSFFFVCVQTPNLWSDKCILEWDQICKGAPNLSFHYFLNFLLFHFFCSSFSVTNHQRYKDLPSAFALQPSVLYFTLSLCFLKSSHNEHRTAFHLKDSRWKWILCNQKWVYGKCLPYWFTVRERRQSPFSFQRPTYLRRLAGYGRSSGGGIAAERLWVFRRNSQQGSEARNICCNGCSNGQEVEPVRFFSVSAKMWSS